MNPFRHRSVALVLAAVAMVPAACGEQTASTPAAAHQHAAGSTPDDPDAISHYTCPMHPSVRAAEPGRCPICGMELVAVKRDEAQSGAVRVDSERLQRIGVRFANVERAPLVRTIRAAGTVAWDETRLVDVSLRVRGWVRELYADALGERVRAGDPLFTLYSPELYAAQVEYLDALRSRASARGGEAPARADALVRAARERLRLWDLAEADVTELARRGTPLEAVPVRAGASGFLLEKNLVEGAAIEPGVRLLRIAPLDRVWIDAQVFESDAPLVAVGQKARVRLPGPGGRALDARVAYVYPSLDAGTRTVRARLELPNPELELRPETWVEVELFVDLGERVLVPTSAVIHAGAKRVVFVERGDGRLEPRRVETGSSGEDRTEIVSGLEPGERIVASGNFLIAAESRLASALSQW